MTSTSCIGAGGLLVAGIRGESLTETERTILAEVEPGGVILFARNVGSVAELQALVASLRNVVPRALLCVDSEGGRVDRLRALVGAAPAAADLATRPVSAAARAGRWIGHSLRAFGLDVSFAPVVDLDRGATDNALDGRYLGGAPGRVVARGRAFLRGLGGSGVGGCVKHFPGLGGARQDTHDHPATVGYSRRELDRDLAPFVALADRAGAVMVAHAAYPALDRAGTPATLSPVIVDGLLRDELGFDGLVVSDDLEMRALDPWGDLPTRTLRALRAGCDALPVCSRIEELPAVAERLERDADPVRIAEASRRWTAYRSRIEACREGRTRPRYRLTTIRRRLADLTARG